MQQALLLVDPDALKLERLNLSQKPERCEVANLKTKSQEQPLLDLDLDIVVVVVPLPVDNLNFRIREHAPAPADSKLVTHINLK
jgi:hypothetical protein